MSWICTDTNIRVEKSIKAWKNIDAASETEAVRRLYLSKAII